MKKVLFILTITTIALTGFRKSDALVVTFNNDNSKVIDLSKKNTLTASWSVTADTTKKGGGKRGDLIPNKGTGKENVPVVGKGETTNKGGGGRGDIITYRGAGNEAVATKGETPKKETGGNGVVGPATKGNNKTEGGVVGKQKDN